MALFFLRSNEEFLSIKTAYQDAKVGGQVVFKGEVRGENLGEEVDHLFYEAYEKLAVKIFNDLEIYVREKFGIRHSIAFHRLGRVLVHEGAVLIAVCAEHRHEAFLACRILIDELKRNVPIWKKEVYKNGTSSWDKPCEKNNYYDAAQKIKPVMKAFLAKGISYEAVQNKRILLVGAGGLGCPIAINLVGLGLKKITIFDGDRVCERNLLRQFIYRETDVGALKTDVIKEFLQERHRDCVIDARPTFLLQKEAEQIAHEFDLIIDGTDCKNTKAMLKKIAWSKNICLISASVHQLQGDVQSYDPAGDGCLNCFSSRDDANVFESCEEQGVLTHVCALVAGAAIEKALLLLCGKQVSSEMTLVDSLGFIKSFVIKKDRHCRVCGDFRQQDQRKKLVKILR